MAPLTYAIMDVEPTEIGLVLAENTGGDRISPFDLDRVKVPSGGGTTWSVPSLEGEEDTKAIEGVIVFQRTVRSFWSQRMEESGGGTPPDCSSQDGVIGIGNPRFGEIEHPDLRRGEAMYTAEGEEIRTGRFDCATCPLAAFGSSFNRRSQACKSSRLLFILREHSIIPLLVAVPPSSLRPIKQYMLRLAGAGVPFYGVVTRLELLKTKNADNIVYGEIVPHVAQRLTPEDTQRMRAVSRSLAPVLSSVTIEAEGE